MITLPVGNARAGKGDLEEYDHLLYDLEVEMLDVPDGEVDVEELDTHLSVETAHRDSEFGISQVQTHDSSQIHTILIAKPPPSSALHEHDPHLETWGISDMDPFNALPQTRSGLSARLAHYREQVPRRMLSQSPNSGRDDDLIGPKKQWMPIAINDPALFHATMFISASHAFFTRKKPFPVAFYEHRAEALSIINARLTDPKAVSSDETIGTILCLLIIDSCQCRVPGVKAHIAILKQFLILEETLRSRHRMIQKVVGWGDVLASIVLEQPPTFPPLRLPGWDRMTLYGPPSRSTVAHGTRLGARLLNFTGLQAPSDAVVRIYWGLRNVTVLKETALLLDDMSLDAIHYSDRAETVERDILALLHSPELRGAVGGDDDDDSNDGSSIDDDDDDDDNDDDNRQRQSQQQRRRKKKKKKKRKPKAPPFERRIFALFCHASLVYVGISLRDLPTGMRIFAAIAAHAEQVLLLSSAPTSGPDGGASGPSGRQWSSPELNVLLGTFPDLMLWALFLCGRVAGEPATALWFAKRAASVLRIGRVDEGDVPRMTGEAFLWPEGRANYDDS